MADVAADRQSRGSPDTQLTKRCFSPEIAFELFPHSNHLIFLLLAGAAVRLSGYEFGRI